MTARLIFQLHSLVEALNVALKLESSLDMPITAATAILPPLLDPHGMHGCKTDNRLV